MTTPSSTTGTTSTAGLRPAADHVAPSDRVVVGYDGGSPGADALAFGSTWARRSGDRLTVVTVHPGPAPIGMGRVDAEWVASQREAADARLAEARSLVPGEVAAEYVRVESGSPAHGLSDLAEPDVEGSPLLVLGSRRGRGLRRTSPGSTADLLLQGAAAPVTVVPEGYAALGSRDLQRVAVAFVDTSDGRHALTWGARIARHLQADLLVVSVVPDLEVVPALADARPLDRASQQGFEDSLDAAVETVGSQVGGRSVERRLLDGPVVDALADLSFHDADLLVVGSRGYGPVRRVLLGGVSSRVLRDARLPVVVTPRGDRSG